MKKLLAVLLALLMALTLTACGKKEEGQQGGEAQYDPDMAMPQEIFKKLNQKLLTEKEEVQKALAKAKGSIPKQVDYREEMMKFEPDKIILGCTHYPYLLDRLEKYAQRSLFVDPAGIFAVYVKEDLRKNELLTPSIYAGKEEFYVSANPEAFVKNAKLFYEVKQLPEVI